jgi:predicted ABC-type ATPase
MKPKIVIVIGSSCAGKSTFVKYYNKYFNNTYNEIDDYWALQEIFEMDDSLWKGNFQEFILYKNKLKYCFEIWETYINAIEKGKDVKQYLCTKYAIGGGHNIIKPLLWNKILKFSLRDIKKNEFYIIQFSRGEDFSQNKIMSSNAYDESLQIIVNSFDSVENILIVNIVAGFNLRKKRNTNRYLNGGHYVSEETMSNVYKNNIFLFNKTLENWGYKIINNFKIPVYQIINNKDLKEINKNSYFLNHIIKIVNNK